MRITVTVAVGIIVVVVAVLVAREGRTREGMQAAPEAHRPVTPPVAPWARPPGTWAFGDVSRPAHRANVREVRRQDKKHEPYDVVVYGDSITSGLGAVLETPWGRASVLAPFFGPSVNFAAFGCPANVVEDVAWRLMSGREKPRMDPRVVVFWIGTNNLGASNQERPEERLDALVAWTKKAMPASHVVILSLLPRTTVDVRPTNAKYARLAAKHGATYVACGQNLDPTSQAYLDGLHIHPDTYAVVTKCLAARIGSLL